MIAFYYQLKKLIGFCIKGVQFSNILIDNKKTLLIELTEIQRQILSLYLIRVIK